jgi:hypothetical protein
MRETVDGPFAVFVKTVRRSNGMLLGANAICDQVDWDAMERNQPGEQPLIRGGIASEVDAERLCRSSPPPAPRPLPAVPRKEPAGRPCRPGVMSDESQKRKRVVQRCKSRVAFCSRFGRHNPPS